MLQDVLFGNGLAVVVSSMPYEPVLCFCRALREKGKVQLHRLQKRRLKSALMSDWTHEARPCIVPAKFVKLSPVIPLFQSHLCSPWYAAG